MKACLPSGDAAVVASGTTLEDREIREERTVTKEGKAMSKTACKALWLVLAVVVGFAATPASAVPITDFILYGENGINIGAGSTITGLVGARNNNPASNKAIKLNGQQTTVDGDARSGGDVALANTAVITGTLFRKTGTTLILGAGASVGTDSVVADPGLPVWPPAIAPLACPTGGTNYSGANNQSLSLAAGTHGALTFGSGFTLTLTTAGTYKFDSITAADNATIVVTATPVVILVCGKVTFSGAVVVQPNSLTPTDLRVEVHGVGANAFRAAGGSDWIGDVFAPFGEIHFGGGTCCSFVAGRFWGDSVRIEHGVDGGGTTTCCQPGPPTSKDATNLHGLKNTNNGANLSLRVGSQIIALAAFDVSAVNFRAVTKAELILTVCYTPADPSFCPDPPSNWPAAGGNVFAQRLNDGFEDWVEGNGNNFPIINNPRGNGPGVTWNCTTDSEIINNVRECTSPNWGNDGGVSQLGPFRGPVLHFNLPTFNDGTKVIFDVTADVQAGLGPNDTKFMTWFIRKPSGSGFVSYYSREGATFLADPTLAPQLVITP
jgi:hypothetical protein